VEIGEMKEKLKQDAGNALPPATSRTGKGGSTEATLVIPGAVEPGEAASFSAVFRRDPCQDCLVFADA